MEVLVHGRKGWGRTQVQHTSRIMPMQSVPIRKRPTNSCLATVPDWMHPLARVALLTAEKL
jgi:hypothetical protein